MISSMEDLYSSLPEELQPIAQKWYYRLNPRLSWRFRKKHDRVDEAFVDRFFDDLAEYESYREEFLGGEIVDICMDAEEAVPNEYSIYDAHRKDCVRYYALIRKRQPEVLVETGVYNGVSTTSILLALEQNGTGTLYSIDPAGQLDEPAPDAARRSRDFSRGRPSCSEPGSSKLPPGKETGWIIPDRLHDYWHLRDGRSQRELPTLLSDLRAIDFFLHDSEHSASCMLFEFELAWEWLNPGGVVLSSHVEWNDAFDTFVEERARDHGLSSFFYLDFDDQRSPCATGYAVKH